MGIWAMRERETALREAYARFPWQSDPMETATHHRRKREYHAKHLLLHAMAQRMGCRFTGLWKDKMGKPFPHRASYHLSVAHTAKYLMASIHLRKNVGVDIERTHRPFRALRKKFLCPEEISHCEENPHLYALHWTAKEVGYKWLSRAGISPKNDMRLKHHPTKGWQLNLSVPPYTPLPLQFLEVDDHVAAYAT